MRKNINNINAEAVLAILLIICVTLLIFTGNTRFDTRWRPGNTLFLGIQRTIGKTLEWTSRSFGMLKRMGELNLQYEEAVEKLNAYRGVDRELVELRRENEELKTLLNFSGNLDFSHIPARIIAHDPSNLFSTLTIDKGQNQNVVQDMPVTAYQNGIFGLVGKVVSSSSRSAQIRPLVDPDNFIASRLQESRFQGLVQGRGNDAGELIMRYVRRSAIGEISINGLVVSSGMQSIYPPGIFIGRISQVISREYSTSLELVLVPVIDISKLEYVMLLNTDQS